MIQTNKKSKFPKLEVLDISRNPELIAALDELLNVDNTWEELRKICVNTERSTTTPNRTVALSILSKADCFPKLRALAFSVHRNSSLPENATIWPLLENIEVYSDLPLDQVLKPTVQGKEKKLFPSVGAVCVYCPNNTAWTPGRSALKHELRSNGVTLQFVTLQQGY